MTKNNRPSTFGLAVATFLAFFAILPARAGIEVSNRTPRQGDTLEVTLVDTAGGSSSSRLPENRGSASDIKETQGDSPVHDDRRLTFNGQTYKFFKVPVASKEADLKFPDAITAAGGYRWQALIAVPADLDPGKYDLQVGGDKTTLPVCAGLFPLQHIKLPPGKDNFDTAPGEEEAVEKAKSTLSPQRFWSGPFSPPSRARRSTGFGLKRVVNGKLLKDYFHSGLDFAGASGSPITACSSGKVVLVGRGFKLHGNTVAIDHGQGVVSFYIHMQTIKVKIGEEVQQGQPIGTVGQTGRATGPHLHFSIYVNKVAANPNCWFATAF